MKVNPGLPTISVVLCTYNRADLLGDAIRSLCDQTLDPAWHEIIVVDNNSHDETASIVDEFCQNYSHLRYYLEKAQGLSHARNRGLKEARGAYVAYIDDDCIVPKGWMALAKEIIERVRPAAFGGPSFAFYNSPKAYWYLDRYGSHDPFKEARVLNREECVNIYGMNMVFDRTVLEKIGGFDPKLGMCGSKIAYAEETALLQFIADNMPNQPMFFDPKLYVYHLVPARKMTMNWIVQSCFSHGRYSLYWSKSIKKAHPGRRYFLKQAAKESGALGVDLFRSVLFRNQTLYPYVQNYLIEQTFRHVASLGLLYEHYKYVTDSSPPTPLTE